MTTNFNFEVAAGRVPNHTIQKVAFFGQDPTRAASGSQYTVPAKKTAMMVHAFISIDSGRVIQFMIQWKLPNENAVVFACGDVVHGYLDLALVLPEKVPTGATISMAFSSTQPTDKISGGYELILIDDTKSITTRGL